jgi:hypothetical protein
VKLVVERVAVRIFDAPTDEVDGEKGHIDADPASPERFSSRV